MSGVGTMGEMKPFALECDGREARLQEAKRRAFLRQAEATVLPPVRMRTAEELEAERRAGGIPGNSGDH